MSDLLSTLGSAPAEGAANRNVRLSDIEAPDGPSRGDAFGNVFKTLSETAVDLTIRMDGPVPGGKDASIEAGIFAEGGEAGADDVDAIGVRGDSAQGQTDDLLNGPGLRVPVTDGGAEGLPVDRSMRSEGMRADMLTRADFGAATQAPGAVARTGGTVEPAVQRGPAAHETPAVLSRPPAVTTSTIPPGTAADGARLDGAGLVPGKATDGSSAASAPELGRAAVEPLTRQGTSGAGVADRASFQPMTRLASNGPQTGAAAAEPGAASSTLRPGSGMPPQANASAQPELMAQPPNQPSGPTSTIPPSSVQATAAAMSMAPSYQAQDLGPRLREVRHSIDAPEAPRTGPPTVTAASATPPAAQNLAASPAASALLQGGEAQVASAGADVSTASPLLQGSDAPARSFDQHVQPGQGQAARPDLARDIGRQMASSISAAADGSVDIALSPKELGQVRMSLSVSENGVTLLVSGDRAETLELMRRHADDLSAAFRDMGYENIAFSFGNGGDTGPSPDDSDQDAPTTADAKGDTITRTAETGQPAHPLRTAPDRGLDLRI